MSERTYISQPYTYILTDRGVATGKYWRGPTSQPHLELYWAIYRFLQGFYKRYLIENNEIHNKIIKVLISRIFQKLLVFFSIRATNAGCRWDAGGVPPPLLPKHTISIASSIKYFGCRSTLYGETRVYLGDFFWLYSFGNKEVIFHIKSKLNMDVN